VKNSCQVVFVIRRLYPSGEVLKVLFPVVLGMKVVALDIGTSRRGGSSKCCSWGSCYSSLHRRNVGECKICFGQVKQSLPKIRENSGKRRYAERYVSFPLIRMANHFTTTWMLYFFWSTTVTYLKFHVAKVTIRESKQLDEVCPIWLWWLNHTAIGSRHDTRLKVKEGDTVAFLVWVVSVCQP